MMEKESNKKYGWISNLRVLATCSVILLHVSEYVAYHQFGHIESHKWWIGNIFDSISRFAVPLFVMVTGALLIPQEIGIKTFMQKRLKRILLPFLFWSVVYVVFSFVNDTATTHYSFFDIVKICCSKVKSGAYYHLWFVYMLIGMYLIIPILKKWVKSCTEKDLIYFLVIWVIVLFFTYPIVNKYMPKIEIHFFTGFVGYLVLGYYLFTKPVENMKNMRKISLVMIIAGILITAFGTWWICEKQGEMNQLFYVPTTPNIFLTAAGIFIFVKISCLNSKKLPRIFSFIDTYGYGIYLGHVFILELLMRHLNLMCLLREMPIIGIPVVTLMCLFITAGIVFCIRKLPVVGKHVSG